MEKYMWVVLMISSLIAICVCYCNWSLNYWSRKNVPSRKPRIPYGNIHKVFLRQETLAANLASVYKEFKSKGFKYCGYYFTLQPVWVVLDPDLLKTILLKDFNFFMNRGIYMNEQNDPLSGHLFLQVGKKWKTLRTKLTPTFTSGKIKTMFPIILDCSNELITVMDNFSGTNQGIDIKDVVSRYTMDIIGRCAFGIDCNTLKNRDSKFSFYAKKSLQRRGNKFVRFLILLCLTTFPWILSVLKIPLFPRDVANFFLKIVEETVEYREQNGINGNDFMHLLIELKNNISVREENDAKHSFGEDHSPSNLKLSIQEVAAQAFVFFVAGYDTSSVTLTFCLYELAANQELQNKARHEVHQIYNKYKKKITYEALSSMTYLDMCINETLRKYPALPILFRECTETYRVPDERLVIEKGTKVLVPILGMHYDSEYFPNPKKFVPERFNKEKMDHMHPFTWLPFGEGPRICIGLRFAMVQMKVALSALLEHYKFTINTRTTTPLVMDPHSFVTTTKSGIWLDIEKIVPF